MRGLHRPPPVTGNTSGASHTPLSNCGITRYPRCQRSRAYIRPVALPRDDLERRAWVGGQERLGHAPARPAPLALISVDLALALLDDVNLGAGIRAPEVETGQSLEGSAATSGARQGRSSPRERPRRHARSTTSGCESPRCAHPGPRSRSCPACSPFCAGSGRTRTTNDGSAELA
jgi:hypothetical protein